LPWSCDRIDSATVTCVTTSAGTGSEAPITTTFTIPAAQFTTSSLTIVDVELEDPMPSRRTQLQDRIFALPKAWIITPRNETSASLCPGPRSILGTFAAVNAISALLGWILGNYSVTKRLTCGLLDRHSIPTSSWYVTWIIPAGMRAAANAAVAAVICRHPDYVATFDQADLTILLFTRPRAGWIPSVVAGHLTNFRVLLDSDGLT